MFVPAIAVSKTFNKTHLNMPITLEGENQWLIGKVIGKKDNDSSPVYGWKYTDKEFIWPDTKSLFMIGI